MTPAEYLKRFLPFARSVSARTGLDPRLVLAQSALETGYGEHAPGGNYFGIKSHGRSGGQNLPTTEFVNGAPVTANESFRGYASPEQSFSDYADFILGNKRYAPVLGEKTLEGQIAAMGKSGYATDPNYAAKLANIASKFDLGGGDALASDTMASLGLGSTVSSKGAPQMAGLLGDMPQQQPQAPQKKTFWDSLGPLSDPDRRARLAMALEGMTMNPNQALIQSLGKGIETRAGERKTAEAQNRTIAMLEKMGADPKLIELAKAGYASEAISQAFAKPKTPEYKEINGKLVRIDPTTGQVTEAYSGGPDADAIANARKEFSGLKPVKDFADQTAAYGRIIASAKDPSPSGDLALIFNFMKVLDPGSTVREGEFATAQNAGGVDTQIAGLYNRIVSGERLTPSQRSDFADRATRLYSDAENQYRSMAEQYAGFASAAGLPVEQVIPDFSYQGQRYQTPLEFQRPPAPTGVTPAEWEAAWAAMTDAERSAFLGGGQP